MGVILSRFRKEKSTYDVLTKLEDDIKDIEAYGVDTQERQKRVVGNFLLSSIGLYVIGFIVFYFAFLPPTWKERIVYSIPLLGFPFLIVLIKQIVAWFFQRKLNSNTKKLNDLRAEKRKILEKVMDKETYKVALDILNRFGDKTNGTKSYGFGALTPISTLSPNSNGKPLIKPAANNVSLLSSSSSNMSSLSSSFNAAQSQKQLTTTNYNNTSILSNMNRSIQMATTPLNTTNRSLQIYNNNNNNGSNPASSSSYQNPYNMNRQITTTTTTTPFPIINQNHKGVFEKMVDYLIGDGPESRYGMICRECFGHNGMVSQEQYEYTAFRCAFCRALNPAKKLRPLGPKLPNELLSNTTIDSNLQMLRNSSSSDDSDPESERAQESPRKIPLNTNENSVELEQTAMQTTNYDELKNDNDNIKQDELTANVENVINNIDKNENENEIINCEGEQIDDKPEENKKND